jgi:hypothetical protein
MNKLILMAAFLSFGLFSCGSSVTTTTPAPVLPAVIECATVPAGAVITSFGCPGVTGTWTRYTINYSQTSETSSGDAYCGGDGSGVPSDQQNFNAIAISDPTTQTSNNDYIVKSNCASGTVT